MYTHMHTTNAYEFTCVGYMHARDFLYVYAFIYIYIYKCIMYEAYLSNPVQTFSCGGMYVSRHIITYTFVEISSRAFAFIFGFMYVHRNTLISVFRCMHYIYIYINLHACLDTCILACIYICKYIYIHRNTHSLVHIYIYTRVITWPYVRACISNTLYYI